jgi:hypothetical protein
MKTKLSFKLNQRIVRLTERKFPRAVSLSMVALAVAVSVTMPAAWAADDGNDFDKLERKLLHVTYPKETSDQRLDRLEKTVFGETRDGSDRERIDRLMSLMPQDDPAPSTARSGGTRSGAGSDNAGANSRTSTASSKPAPESRDDDGTEYPAVSAIEKKLFGQEFSHEPVETRLTRLEKKAFGKQSSSNDLVDRMDALKAKTGIDIARQPSAGTDWNDEDEDDTDYPEPSSPISRRYPGVSPQDSGRSFSGRDVGGDLNRAFGRSGSSGSYGGGSGAYGMGGGGMSSSSGSGSYGFGGGSSGLYGGGSRAGMKSSGYGSPSNNRFGSPKIPTTSPDDDDDDRIAYTPRTAPAPRSSQMPPTAPSRGAAGSQASSSAGGLTVQLDALESQVLGKTYQEPMMQRLDRLENIVFPNDKTAKSRTPAERVARISSVLGGSTPVAQSQQGNTPDVDGYGGDQGQMGDPQIAQQPQRRKGGGLGGIINSLGNFLGGGMAGMSVGSYPMQSGGLVTDPTTGYLLDQYSGNLINPTTGAIMGRRAVGGYGSVPNYGMNFNNGFSNPYINPMYSNPMYGIGGSGVRFGTGGFRFGGGF